MDGKGHGVTVEQVGSTILEVEQLRTHFHTLDGVVHAVNGVSFHLREGETLGIVGESGCGKSVTMHSVMGLIPQPPGEIVQGTAKFMGADLLALSADELRTIRGRQIGMVFQDPMTSLNPVMPIGKQVIEPMQEHLGLSKNAALDRAVGMLDMVGIPGARDRIEDYPHQFSGGMRQRVMIAMALACDPQILIADEPTTALDVTIQAQIVELVMRLRQDLDMAIIWITHDLGVIAGLADRMTVLYAGLVVEEATVDDLYQNPSHPYTLALLGSLPRLDQIRRRRLVNIEGRPPDLMSEPAFCPFAPRCAFAQQQCWQELPRLRSIGDEHNIACWVDVEETLRKEVSARG